MFEEQRLGNDATEASRPCKPDDAGNQMKEKDDDIAHPGMVSKPKNYPILAQFSNSPWTGLRAFALRSLDHTETDVLHQNVSTYIVNYLRELRNKRTKHRLLSRPNPERGQKIHCQQAFSVSLGDSGEERTLQLRVSEPT